MNWRAKAAELMNWRAIAGDNWRAKLSELAAAIPSQFRYHGRLRPKFVLVFTTVVCVALISTAAFEVLFSDPHSARAGRSRGRRDRRVHEDHRGPARLDHPRAVDDGDA
jgi:hypothetical protein